MAPSIHPIEQDSGDTKYDQFDSAHKAGLAFKYKVGKLCAESASNMMGCAINLVITHSSPHHIFFCFCSRRQKICKRKPAIRQTDHRLIRIFIIIAWRGFL